MARNALGLQFGSAAPLSKRPGSVWNCLWGNALKRSPGINHKSRVWYPGPRFLSSATWPLLTKKHYNGIINQSWSFKRGDLSLILLHIDFHHVVVSQKGLVCINTNCYFCKPQERFITCFYNLDR